MAAKVELQGIVVELRYLGSMTELDNAEIVAVKLVGENVKLSLVGAGIGSGFANTSELKVMNYREAMKSKDDEAWEVEIGYEKLTDSTSLKL